MTFKKISLSVIFIIILALFANNVLAKEIKIVQLSDIHLDTTQKDREVRKFAQSVPMLKKAISKINKINPDIVVVSGDMVNSSSEKELDTFITTMKNLQPQFYPIWGNHDVGVKGGLSKNKIYTKLDNNFSWLNIEKPYYYKIKGEYIFIFMDGTTDTEITAMGYFSKEVLNFLEETLKEYPSKKAIIVQHFPIMPPFKSASHEIKNKNEYLAVIDKYPNIIMVLCGHYHAAKAVERNNVLYITTPSLIEYPHAFRYLTVNSTKDTITISSKLILDEEQNAAEGIQGPYGKLKLGKEKDNIFTITLKNNVPQDPKNIINDLFDF